MTDFLIRNLDPHVLEQLKKRAELHGRSLQAEVHDTLKRSVRLSKAESIERAKAFRNHLPVSTTDSTDLIREDRDSR